MPTNPIVPKRNSTAGNATGPAANALQLGEIASNTFAGKLYLKKEDGTVAEFGASSGNMTTPVLTSITGNGSTTTFSIGGYTSNEPKNYLVVLGGVPQKPDGTAYTINNGQIVFSSAPANGVTGFVVAYQASITPSSNFATETKTATAGQTVFTLTSATYTPSSGSLRVFRNGLLLTPGDDYAETNSSTITLTSGATVSDQFIFLVGRIANDSTVYQLAATGSISRGVASKLGDTISVKDFGAVGNGTTDDTAAIQAALDAVDAAGGGAVYVPATSSFYNLTAALRIGSNTTLYGDGMDASRLKWSVLPQVAAGSESSGGARRAIVNKNLTLSGTQNTSIAVRDLKVDLTLITGALSYARQAIFFFNCTFTSVTNCHILCDGGCVLNVKVTNYIVDSNYCEQIGTYNSSDGMVDQWWGSQNGIVANNYIDGKLLCQAAILLTGSDTTGGVGGTISNIKFLGNTIKNARQHGIWVEGRIDVAQNIDISNNTINTCGDGTAAGGGYGIRVLTCNDVLIAKNQIYNCQLNGIMVSSAQGESWTRNGSNCIISNNIIKNVALYRSAPPLTTHDAIGCFYTNNVQILGNQISPLSTAKYEYAIQIDTIAVDAVIADNIIVPGYYADAINFGSNQTIKIYRNVGFVTEASGQATISSGSTSVTVTTPVNFNIASANAPVFITITPLNIPSNMSSLGTPIVTNFTTNTFQVVLYTAPSSNFVFRWSIVRL